jgi:hypothetical protein
MRVVCVAVAVVSLVGFAACGDDDGGQLTKAGFIAQSDEVCAGFFNTANAPLGQIFEGGKILMDSVVTAFPQVQTAIRTFLDERGSLEAPDTDRETVADITATERRTFEKLLADARAAIDIRDAEALGAAFDRADNGFQRIDEAQQAYGFQMCGAYQLPTPADFVVLPATGPTGTRRTVRSTTPCAATPPEATGTQVRVELWSTSTRLATRGGRILVDVIGPIAPDGSWNVEVDVPTTAMSGKHAVYARCEALMQGCTPACPYAADLADATLVVVPAS